MHKDCAPEVWQTKPCQEWPQQRARPGYGEVIWRGKIQYVHRIAFALSHGLMVEDLSGGDVICHHCDNPPCFEPAHLFRGTRELNMHDMRDKGRHRWGRTVHYGEAHPAAKLTDEQVLEIRVLYGSPIGRTGRRQDGLPRYADIAKRYGVTPALIGMIVRLEIWQHI